MCGHGNDFSTMIKTPAIKRKTLADKKATTPHGGDADDIIARIPAAAREGNLKMFKVAELKEYLEEIGLTKSGKKDDLTDRIEMYLRSKLE